MEFVIRTWYNPKWSMPVNLDAGCDNGSTDLLVVDVLILFDIFMGTWPDDCGSLDVQIPIPAKFPMQLVYTPDAVPPLPVFSQATISGGYVYVSGNIGCNKEFKLVEGGIQAETRAALENLSIVLKAAGSGLEHIVKANIYMLNMKTEFQLMNETYAKFFASDKMPARTCVGVAYLPFGAAMEMECIAEIPK